MSQFDSLMTGRVLEYFNLVQDFNPKNPIQIHEMVDENLLKLSAGFATREEEDGREIIYVDPKRATKYGLLHEIMHIKLHRTGWPRTYKMIPRDEFGERLADSLDNSLDHFVFYEELSNLIDISEYRDSFIAEFDGWPKTEVIGESIIWNAFIILDGFSFGETYKKQIIKMVNHHSEALNLALKLEKIRNKNGKDKQGIRKSMVESLRLVDRYLQSKIKTSPNLFQRVGISPLFNRCDLSSKASSLVSLVSTSIDINGEGTGIAAFVLKSDKTRFKTYVSKSGHLTDEIDEKRHALFNLSLKDLLESENIRYVII